MKKITYGKKARYLIVGAINTIAGYFIGVYTYNLFINSVSILFVGIMSNVIAVTFSFITYKLFVFKSSGNWMIEYTKSCLVNGVMSMMSIFLLWMFIEKMKISIWVSQGMILICTATLSYISHENFTFSKK